MKVIYDNIIFQLQKTGGISVYWKEMCKRLNTDDEITKLFIEYYSDVQNLFARELDLKNVIKKYAPKFHRYLNLHKNAKEKTIFHSSYYRVMHGKKIINVVSVNDFIYEYKMKSFKKNLHIWQKRRAIKKANGIICISNHTKEDMYKLYPKAKMKECRVIHLGYNDQKYYHLEDYKTKNNVLFVGGRDDYKNFKAVVHIVSRLEDTVLNIVGHKLNEKEILFLDMVIPLRYKIYQNITSENLNVLYNEAICLLYLSSYEGFGIPLLESMAASCPVIALDSSSISEVSGNAAILFKDLNYEEIANTIIKLKNDFKLRNEIIQKGYLNIKRFSWDKCYQETKTFYEYLLKK